jgi:hypothetical protein
VVYDSRNAAFEHLRRAGEDGDLNLLRRKVIQPTPNGIQPILELAAVAKPRSQIFGRVSMGIRQAWKYQTVGRIEPPRRGGFDLAVWGNTYDLPVLDKNVGALNLTDRVRKVQAVSALDQH